MQTDSNSLFGKYAWRNKNWTDCCTTSPTDSHAPHVILQIKRATLVPSCDKSKYTFYIHPYLACFWKHTYIACFCSGLGQRVHVPIQFCFRLPSTDRTFSTSAHSTTSGCTNKIRNNNKIIMQFFSINFFLAVQPFILSGSFFFFFFSAIEHKFGYRTKQRKSKVSACVFFKKKVTVLDQ